MSKTLIHFYLDKKTVEDINNEVKCIGFGATRSGFIVNLLQNYFKNKTINKTVKDEGLLVNAFKRQ